MAIFMESERLWFRAPEKSDAPFFTRMLQDPRVRHNLLAGHYPFNEDAEAAWLENISRAPALDGKTSVHFTFGIKGEDEPLGVTDLSGISMLHRRAGFAMFIGRPEEWGKGYGREVVRTMLRYGFRTLNLQRIYLYVNADNEGGIRAYRAAGFVDEGVMRQHIFRDGEYVDWRVMGVLRDEWEA